MHFSIATMCMNGLFRHKVSLAWTAMPFVIGFTAED